jgi:uncharacterized repeat protein (TIGR02543 family)
MESGSSVGYWRASYHITDDPNGGVGGPGTDPKVYLTGAVANLIGPTPARLGCTFAGWAYSATATSPDFVYNASTNTFSPTSFKVGTGNITLYAVWSSCARVVLPVFYFATDKWDIHLTKKQYTIVVTDLKLIAAAGITHLISTGFADIRSTVAHNNFLSIHRAQSAANYLTALEKKLGLPTTVFALHVGGQTTQFGLKYQSNRKTVISY